MAAGQVLSAQCINRTLTFNVINVLYCLHIVFEFVVIFHADKLSKLPKYIIEPRILFTVKSHEKEPTLFS